MRSSLAEWMYDIDCRNIERGLGVIATMAGPTQPPLPNPAEVVAPWRNLIFTAVLLGMLLARISMIYRLPVGANSR